jgi:hypothetical protein
MISKRRRWRIWQILPQEFQHFSGSHRSRNWHSLPECHRNQLTGRIRDAGFVHATRAQFRAGRQCGHYGSAADELKTDFLRSEFLRRMICADALFDGHHGPDGADRGNLLIGPLSRRLSRKIYAAAIISGELGVRLPALAIAINQVGFQRYVFARLQTGCPDDPD